MQAKTSAPRASALPLAPIVSYPGLVMRRAPSAVLQHSIDQLHCICSPGQPRCVQTDPRCRWILHKRALAARTRRCPACANALYSAWVTVRDDKGGEWEEQRDNPWDLPDAAELYCPRRGCFHAFRIVYEDI